MNIKKFNLQQNLKLALEFIGKRNFSDAINLYRKIIEIDPNNFEANMNLGTIFAQRDDLEEAIKLWKKAIEINPNDHGVHNNLGLSYVRTGENDKAIKYLELATKLNPNDSNSFSNLGFAQNQLGEYEKAKSNLLKAISLNPKNFMAHYNIGNLYKKLNEINKSEKYYYDVLKISPKFLNAYINLMDLYERSNQDKKLEEIINKSEKYIKNNATIELFKGNLLYKSKKYSDVIEKLESIKFTNQQNKDEMLKEGSRTSILAKCYDHTNDIDKAFKYFKLANEVNFNSNKDRINKNNFINIINKRINYFEKQKKIEWPTIKANINKNDPIFLVGFPRSGTTLLDTILRSHPSVEVIEEKPIIDEFIIQLHKKTNSNLDTLKVVNENLLNDMRNIYFDRRNQYVNEDKNKIYIDKMPLNIIYIGEIIRIFPNAKFILAIRHPCDCVLSCFMQNFVLNDSMANFLNLNDSAKFYDLVMSLWEKHLKIFSVNYHTVKYEDIVSNFDQSVRKLLNFLDLKWSDNVNEFYKTAKTRGIISTPSYNQVNQPIYSKSMGRWKKYENQLSDILPILNPWIKKYGY